MSQPGRGRITPFRYGTAGTTTTTTLASSGGLLIDIDSATGDIPQTASGWIEDEKFGFNARELATSTSAEFDTAVTIDGYKTLKLSTLDATGVIRCLPAALTNYSTASTNLASSGKFFPVKGSTKYRFKFKAISNNLPTNGFQGYLQEMNISGAAGATSAVKNITGTTTETVYESVWTTGASATMVGFFFGIAVAGNIADVWIGVQTMTLEEVVEPVANSLTSSSPSLVSFTAVGSTDNIDQSLDHTFVAANTYTPPVAISETATNKQTFVPTKSKVTRIGVYPVAKGTGNWTVTIHDASNVSQGSITIANASLTNGAVNYFNIPCNLTAGATYHFHVTSTVADGTVRVATAADLETVSYIQNYYKPTTNFKASQNNKSVSISADEDGFIESGVHNLTTGTWSFTDSVNDGSINNNMYFSRTTGCIFASNTVQFSGAGQNYILKINLGVPANGDMTYTIGFITNNTISYSYDNVSYTTLGTLVAQGGSYTIPMTGYSTVYIKNNANASGSMTNHSGSCPINVSSLSTLKNYPTNKDIIKQYSTTLGSPTTSATYRATKWGHPAIEYSATEYQYLDVDTTATGSTVAFSELGTSYTTVADGASLTITSTSTPNIFVKANITANRLYLSSNDLNASSDKDGSLKQSVIYKVMQ